MGNNTVGTETAAFMLVVQYLPRPAINPLTLTISETNSVTFTCTVSAIPQATVTWFTDSSGSQQVLSSGAGVSIAQTVSENQITNTLTLTSVTRFNEGQYICSSSNVLGTATVSGNLSVLYAPTFYDQLQNASVAEPSSATFTCSAAGHPQPTLTWQRFTDGVYTTITQSSKYSIINTPSGDQNQTSTLTIFSSSPQDSTQYVCRAQNILGSSQTMATLSVRGIPVIYQPPLDTSVSVSDTAMFNCSVSGQPTLEVEWFRQLPNGTLDPISAGGSYSILNNIVSMNLTSSLSISSVTPMDGGMYVCRANSGGITYSSSTAVLTVLGGSVSISPAIVTRVENDSVTFTCITNDVESPVFSWYFSSGGIQQLLFNSDSNINIQQLTPLNSSLTVVSTSRSDAGQYICSVTSSSVNTTAVATLTVYFAPTIYQLVQDQVAVQPNTATFTCSANGLPQPAISWLRLVNGQQLTISQSSKYSIVTALVGTQNVTSTLTVSNTAIDDAVSYTCNATNQAGSAASTGSLAVQVASTIYSSYDLYTANETTPVTFQCTSTGIPTPSITWYRNGAALTPSSDSRVSVGSPSQQLLSSGLYQVTQTLTITNTTDTDSGNYSCMGNNTAGTNTALFVLVVQISPTITASSTDLIVPAITDQTFTCSAEGVPRPSFSWIRRNGNDSLLIDVNVNTQYSITYTDVGDRGTTSSIYIANASPFEVGDYVCVASNVLGQATAQASLAVYIVPSAIPDQVTTVAAEMSTVTFSCQATGIPSPTISWYRNGAMLSRTTDPRITIGAPTEQLQITQVYSVTRNITITNIAISDTGLYSCVGTNAYGNGSNAFTLTVQHLPRVMLVASNQSVSEQGTVVLTCTVTGLPKPNITWSIDNTTLTSQFTGIQITQTEQGDQITGRLTISPVNRDHAGQYTCTATNSLGSSSNSTTLSVRYVPYVQQLQNQTVLLPATAMFSCTARAYPAPTIQWLVVMDGITVPIPTTSKFTVTNSVIPHDCICQVQASTLIVSSLTPYDATQYICRATNSEGSTDSAASLTVQVTPAVNSTGTVYVTNETAPVTFQCTSTGIPTPSITWYRNGAALTPSSDPRVSVGSPSQQLLAPGLYQVTQTLTITNTADTDSGNYSCMGTNAVGTDTALFSLVVQIAANITQIIPNSLSVTQPASASFTCIATGLPRPTIRWTKGITQLSNNTQIVITESVAGDRQATSMLTLLQTSTADIASYNCIAENPAGSNTVSSSLTVYVTPTITSNDADQVITSSLGTSATLSFTITDASPAVQTSQIRWIYSSSFSTTPTSNGSNIDITNLQTLNSASQFSFSSDLLSLTISNIVAADDGRYFLVATTVAGSAFSYIDIIVEGPPVLVVQPLDQTIINTASVTFQCEALAHPLHDVVWRFNGSYILGTNDIADTAKYSINRDRSIPLQFGSLTVSNVQYSDRGVYQCTAVNSVGSVSASATLTVHVLPSILSSSGPVSEVINSSASLFCSVRGYPLPTISWLKDSLPVATDSSITITTQSATSVSPEYLQQLNTTFTGDVGVISVLQFSSLQRKDDGIYSCLATNSFNQTGSFSAITDPITITVLEVPSAPGVSSISYTAVSVYLSWSIPSFIGNSAVLGYKVYQRAVDSESTLTQLPGTGQYTTTATMINITTNISPYTIYEFAVEACNMIGCSSNRLMYSPFRTSPAAPGSAPRDCLATAVSSTSISTSWSAPSIPNGLIQYYTVSYRPVQSLSGLDLSSTQSNTTATTDNSTQLALSQLLKGTSYSIMLTAYTVVGPGPSSTDQCTTYTLEDAPDGPPASVSITTTTVSTITVTWSPPDLTLQNGRIISYKLLYTSDPSQNDDQRQSVTINATIPLTYQLPNLLVNTRYYIKIAAATSAGLGPYTNAINAPTLNSPPPPPTGVQATVQDRTITVTWGSVSSASAYKVYYQASKSYDVEDRLFSTDLQTVNTTGTQVTISSGLYPASTYTVYITSVNAAGEGIKSTSVTAVLAPTAPETVPTMSVSLTDGVTLSLTKPSNINGELSHYQLVVVYLPTIRAPAQSPDVAFPENNLLTYQEVQNIKSRAVAYVAAEFTDDNFPANGQFTVGGRGRTSDYPDNGDLTAEEFYTFFLRAFPKISAPQKRQAGSSNRQYTVYSSSDYSTPIQATDTSGGTGANIAGLNQPVFFGIIAAVAVVVLVIFAVIIIVIVIMAKRTKKAGQRFDVAANMPIINPVFENRGAVYDEFEDDWDVSMRAMEKEQEMNEEPFPVTDEERYASFDTVFKSKPFVSDEKADL